MPYKDKEKNREYQRNWARNNKDKRRKSNRKWREKNKEKIRQYNKNVVFRVKQLLGGKCIYCGCDIPEALEINHKEGGGRKVDMKGSRLTYYFNILSGKRSIDDLELTCRICNNWHYLVKLKGIPDGWIITWEDQKI